MHLTFVSFLLVCVQLLPQVQAVAQVEVTVDATLASNDVPNALFKDVTDAWDHVIEFAAANSPEYTEATVTFLPGTYPITAIQDKDESNNYGIGRPIGNFSMRNVAESPGTVKIEAAPDQLSDLEEMTPYYTFTENIYGVNTYLEFTGINISLARNTSFGVRLEGTNTILNITDCIVEGELDDVGGSNSHVYFRVGAIDSAIPARPAHFHSYRTTYKDTRLVTTLYGMTSGVVKGGSAMGMHTRTGSVLRGNFGSLLVEDFDFIGAPTLQHYSALIALQMSNGKDTPEFQTGGLTLKNVKFEGNMLREHLVRLEIGNSKFTDVTIAGNMAVGPDPTNDMLRRSLVRLQAGSKLIMENVNIIDNVMDLMVHTAIGAEAEIMMDQSRMEGNVAPECIRISKSNFAMSDTVFARNECVFSVVDGSTLDIHDSHFEDNGYRTAGSFVDVDNSQFNVIDSTFTGSHIERGSFINLRNNAAGSLSTTSIIGSRTFHSTLVVDASSSIAIDRATFAGNEAERTDFLQIRSANAKITQSNFLDNASLRKDLMRVTAGTTLTLENSNFAANQNPIVVDSQASLVVKSSTFEGNAPNSAIVSSGSVSVSDSTFRNNIATSKGGAIRHTPKSGQGYLTLLNSLFDSNVADNDGGAVYVDAGFDPLIVENLVFSNNKAQRGGALYQAQSEHSSIGTNALAQIQLNGNEATLQGDNFATGLDHLEATPSRPLSLLSGATLADIEVRAVDKYNNTYFPPRTALPKLGLSLKNSGTLVGSIAKFALNGTVKFAQIQLYAPVGAQELLIAPAISTYDATRYQTKLNVKTLPCTQQGLEERVLVASPHPACLKAVCSNGCLSDYGYCRNNFCHCTAPDREGINCGLKKGNRDVLTLTLPNSWTPTAENRDNLLDTIQEKLSTNATVEFRSFETSASAGSLFRRADPVTIFRVALKSPSGQYIEQAALTTFSGVVSTALAPVVGEPVVVETKESPKGRVTGSGFVPILIMVLTGIAMLISITFAGFLTIYRDTRSVKASSLVFSQLIIFGTILGYSLIFLYVGTPSSALCVSQVWVGGVAYTLAVGNLVGKTWRIYKIFTTRGKARPMKDIHVLMLTLGMLAVELTLDALWTGLAPLEPTLKETDGSRFWVCDSPNAANRPLTFLNLAWKAILLLTACVLAFLTRNVDVMYGESKAIGASSYVMLLAGAIVVPVVFLPQTESQTAFYLKAAGILLSGVVTNICLFWPKLYSAMVIESGNDSFLRTFTRRTSRRMGSSTAGKVSSGKGSSSSEEPSVAQAQRSPQEAAQDLAIVQAPAQCSVYMKGAIAGKYTPCSIVTDTQAGIILISPSNTKNEKQLVAGISFRLEHMTSYSWDKNDKSMLLQAGDYSLPIIFTNSKTLQAYINEIHSKTASTASGTTPSRLSFVQGRIPSRTA